MNSHEPILLIDDNRAWLDALAEYLRRRGFVVFTTADPAQGLQFVRDHPVSLVLCDCQMPGMSGVELIRELRLWQRNLAIVMVSSEDQRFVAARALAVGARAFLDKGTSPAILLRRIRQILAEGTRVLALPFAAARWDRLLPSPRRVARLANIASRKCEKPNVA